MYYRLGTSIEHSRNKYFTDPPSDAGKWIDVVSNVIRHYTEGKWNGYRYDIEYWEIWNDPIWVRKCGPGRSKRSTTSTLRRPGS